MTRSKGYKKMDLTAPLGFFAVELEGTAKKMAAALIKAGFEVVWGECEDNRAEVVLGGICDPYKIQKVLEEAGVDSIQVDARFRFVDSAEPHVKLSTRVFRYYGAFGHE